MCTGDPEDVVRTLKRYQEIGLDQVVLVPQIGWHVPHEKTLESIANFGKYVLPKLSD